MTIFIEKVVQSLPEAADLILSLDNKGNPYAMTNPPSVSELSIKIFADGADLDDFIKHHMIGR